MSVTPSRFHFGLYLDREDGIDIGIDYLGEEKLRLEKTKEVKEMWRVGGIEIISPTLDLEDQEDWVPKFEQIQADLRTEHERAFFYNFHKDQLLSRSGLHVYMAISELNGDLNSPLGFRCMKNIYALYGLFEDEIGRWLEPKRRDSIMAVRIRLGEEFVDKFASEKDRLKTYIPQKFTISIYEAENVQCLKEIISGSLSTKYYSINISDRRGNKPTIIEFRQYHGVIKATTIKWWVIFLGYLVKHSYFLAQLGIEVRDNDKFDDISLDPLRPSCVETYSPDRSILDVVGMSDEGKDHFKKMAEKHKNDNHDAGRELDLFIIKRRAAHMRRERKPISDHQIIFNELEAYNKEVERLEGKYNCDLPYGSNI